MLPETVYMACTAGNADVVRKLLEHGASIDVKAQDGTTSLLAATRGGHLTVVNLLLEAGADPNNAGASAAYRSMGTTSALHQASADGSTAIAMALLDAGADIHYNQVRVCRVPVPPGRRGFFLIVRLHAASFCTHPPSLPTDDARAERTGRTAASAPRCTSLAATTTPSRRWPSSTAERRSTPWTGTR